VTGDFPVTTAQSTTPCSWRPRFWNAIVSTQYSAKAHATARTRHVQKTAARAAADVYAQRQKEDHQARDNHRYRD
jgi:hypothetical protein